MPNNDYILRRDALKAILEVSIYDTLEGLDGARTIAENTWADGLWDAIMALCEMDTADVAPVKHGHWVYKMRERNRYENLTGTDPLGETHTVTVKTHVRGPVPYCSLCDALAADSFLDYCPRCGAKMDLEENKS